ncbi:bifunctional phosphoribosylaminoimidazolecarboxamide formyltransferase/IMP cyclohydrolase [Winkia neuii]|uniref:bifunctional phosphoribosylaminoimidazolecarboxamide formyltransferase/IMP cyclohydrolase n=1 Tax=Winkia neuii TaxID=33007 RepID=UPI003703FF53
MSVPIQPTQGEAKVPIKRALISVYDKTGLEDLVSALSAAGVQIVSTGSTAKRIEQAGANVTEVSQVTGFPECLDGRVKTLHPKIHAGILADRRKTAHCQELEELGVAPFDLVVCNLYPFTETVRSGADFDACVEQIDIGGPSMVRAAAKNHASVAVITDPSRYDDVVQAVKDGGFTGRQRRELAADAFAHTAEYDVAVSEWFDKQLLEEDFEGTSETDYEDSGVASGAKLPELFQPLFVKAADLRYGENPHQEAALYVELEEEDLQELDEEDEGEEELDINSVEASPAQGIAGALTLGGKPMSYNNYSDADAALRAAYDHPDQPCVAIIKHANPCGIAVAEDVAAAHRKAHACDPVSAYGGVIAVNRPVTLQLARQIKPIFTEVVVAPSFEADALELLRTKKNLRILQVTPPERGASEIKPISGGLLVQARDDVDAPGDSAANWKLAAGKAADEATLADLEFAWRTIRAVRSNAVLLAKDGATVGVGMGQVNRVDSAKLAIERANTLGARSTGDAAKVDSAGGARADEVLSEKPEERARGAVAASDAFFPFADGLQVLIDAGVKAVVQPGGSIRDGEVIEAAEKAGITMYFTGTRHFAH